MKSGSKVIIFGTEDFAELAHYYLEKDTTHNVVAFTVDRAYIKEPTFKGLPVVPFEEIEHRFDPSTYKMFAPLSPAKMNRIRATKYLEGKKKGYEFISYVSSKATVWDNAEIGENCFILEDNTIQPFTKIGNNVVLWSGNHIGHHSTISDHCTITSHVVVSGHVMIGPYSFFGVNSTLRDGIEIGEATFVAAGALITKNTPPGSFFKTKAAELQEITSDKL
jgi:sugar O-acyltransferase (sialic acid O-acetyltransferase NeuD family)